MVKLTPPELSPPAMDDIQGNTQVSISPATGCAICVVRMHFCVALTVSIVVSATLFAHVLFEATQISGSEAEITCRLGRLNPRVSFLHAHLSLVKATQNGGSMGEIISNDLCRLLPMQTISGSFCVALSSRVP